MKKSLVMFLEWNTILISYLLTPFLLGFLCLSFVEWQSGGRGILTFAFEEPLKLSVWGTLVGSVAVIIPLWSPIARRDHRNGVCTLVMLSLAVFIAMAHQRAELKFIEPLEKPVVLYILFSLYLLRYVSLLPGLRRQSAQGV